MTLVLYDTKVPVLSCGSVSYSKGWKKENMSEENLGTFQGLEVVSEVPNALMQISVLICFSTGMTQAELMPRSGWSVITIHPPLE